MTSEAIDYDELVEKIIQDCGISEMCDDLTTISTQINENKMLNKEQFKTMMTLVNRLDNRLDLHMESQATQPVKTVDELKRWLTQYMDNYITTTNIEVNNQKEKIEKHHKEIFGNGKKALRTEIESLKTKATITLWLVGILLTGGGISGAAYIIWQIILGG